MYHISELPSSSYKTVLKNHLAWNFLQCSSECEANWVLPFCNKRSRNCRKLLWEIVSFHCLHNPIYKKTLFHFTVDTLLRVLRIGRRSWILIYMYCGIIPIRGVQCSWIIYTFLVRGDAISWVTGLLHYNAGQFITFWNIRGDINSW